MRIYEERVAWAVKISAPHSAPFLCGVHYWSWMNRQPSPFLSYTTGITIGVFKTRREAREHARILNGSPHRKNAHAIKVIIGFREQP